MPVAPKKTLEQLLEDAILTVLTAASLGTYANLYTGHDFDQRSGSQVLVTCFGGAEIVYNSGNYLERVRISVRSRADSSTATDPRATHADLVQRVREALHVNGIEATLSAAATDFTCNLFYPADSNASVEGRYFVTSLEYEADCVRADVS